MQLYGAHLQSGRDCFVNSECAKLDWQRQQKGKFILTLSSTAQCAQEHEESARFHDQIWWSAAAVQIVT